MYYSATYSPDDNKLRLSATARLDAETYARVRAAGFIWAPKQEIFVAPMWTPEREDLCIELAGEIEDEDKTLIERAEERAERFDELADKRTADYHAAHKAVENIAKRFEFGQPILVGHHSEKRARKDKERIDNGMRRAVKAFETAEYFTSRAAGAIRHAKYKERPDVRARRIKKLEAELRKVEKNVVERTKNIKLWNTVDTHERAFAIAGSGHYYCAPQDDGKGYWTAYDVLRPNGERYRACPAIAWEEVKATVIARLEGYAPRAQRWIEHYNLRLAYERAMLGESGYIAPPKRVGRAALPLLNYAGETLVKGMYGNPPNIIKLYPITKAEFAKIRGENKGTRVAADGTHRVRVVSAGYVPGAKTDGHVSYSLVGVCLTDAKQHTKPGTTALETREQQETQARIEKAQKQIETNVKMRNMAWAHNAALVEKTTTVRTEAPAEVKELRQALAAGPVKVIAVPQLFPTPPDLAARMVELAQIKPGERVLEPSAGTGNLVCAAIEYEPECVVTAIEINYQLAKHMRVIELARDVICADFLEGFPGTELDKFDVVLMNPPFANGDDIKHIQHAARFLKHGGRLVAICANGPRQQEKLKPLAEDSGGMYEPLPAGTFADAGTNVNTALLVIENGAKTFV